MQVLCLDESGKCTNPDEVNFIAGFCCSVKDEQGWNHFCNEIYRALQERCAAAGRTDFPGCLHSTSSWENWPWRRALRDITQELYAAHNAKDAVLRPVCMLQYGGVTAFNFQSSMFAGQTASNLYDGMLSALLEGVLYHNPYINATETIKIELPTRQAMLWYPANASPETIEELDRQATRYIAFGHTCQSIPCTPEYSKKLMFNTVDSRGVHMMLQAYPRQQQIEAIGLEAENIKIRSINYHQSAPPTMAGMYLADLTCEWLKDYLFHTTQHTLRISAGSVQFEAIADEIQRSVQNRPLLFESTPTDTLYRQASTALHQNRLSDVIASMYALSQMNSPVSRYYLSLLDTRIIPELFTNDAAVTSVVASLGAQYKAA